MLASDQWHSLDLALEGALEEVCQVPRPFAYHFTRSSIKLTETQLEKMDMSSLVTKETTIFQQLCQSPKFIQTSLHMESFTNTIPDEPKEEENQQHVNRYQLQPSKSFRVPQQSPPLRKLPNIFQQHMDASNCCFYLSSLKVAVNTPERLNTDIQKLYQLHYSQTISQVQQQPQFPPPALKNLKPKLIYLPPQAKHPRQTLILDLDETMVHCNEDLEQKADFYLSIQISYGFNIKAGVRVRPHLISFLEDMNKHFEIIVFTASHRIYAEAVLNKLDPNGQLVHFLFSRESCVQDKGCYIKDLRVVQGRDLSQIILVDNSTMSFIYQLENGVPIIPFYNNEADNELLSLGEFLKQSPSVIKRNIAKAPDVREVIKPFFQLERLSKFTEPKEAVDVLYRF